MNVSTGIPRGNLHSRATIHIITTPSESTATFNIHHVSIRDNVSVPHAKPRKKRALLKASKKPIYFNYHTQTTKLHLVSRRRFKMLMGPAKNNLRPSYTQPSTPPPSALPAGHPAGEFAFDPLENQATVQRVSTSTGVPTTC